MRSELALDLGARAGRASLAPKVWESSLVPYRRTGYRTAVMHHGKLRERGTHDELLAKHGIYAKLYRLHFAEHGAART